MTVKRFPVSAAARGPVALASSVLVEGGKLLFVSGHLSQDENRQIVGKDDIKAQTRQVLDYLGQAIERAGGKFSDIVKVTVFVKDMAQAPEIYQVRLEYFDQEHLPASSMIEVSRFVHPDALIEIEAMAVLDG